MNPRLESTLDWLKRFVSPVTLLCIAGLCYIMFGGRHTVFNSIDYDRTIDSLNAVLEANRDTMLYYRDLNRRLETDPELMEEVVREQYGMKRASEDVFIFNETPPTLEN